MRKAHHFEFVGVKMPAVQRRRLFETARERGVTASEIIRQALDAFAEKAA